MGVSSLGKFLDIQHSQGGVGNGLAEHHLGVGPEGSVQLLLGAQRVHKGGLNAHLLHGDGDEVEGAAVDGAGCHDMVTGLAEVEQGKEVGCLTAGGQHGGGAALQLADLLGHKVTGGVLQAGVEVAVGFQVEQLAHILAGGIFEGGGLDDGDLAGLAIAGRITALHTDGITVHCNILLYWVCPNSTIPRRSTCLRRGIETLNLNSCSEGEMRRELLPSKPFGFASSLSEGAGARSATEGVTSSAAYRFWWPRRCQRSGRSAPAAPAG